MITRRKIIRGTSISSGIAMGQAQIVVPGHLNVAEIRIAASRVKAEIAALDQAVDKTISGLEQLRDSARKKMGSSVTKIFDAQLLIAGDQEFLSRVKGRIVAGRRNAGFVYNSLVQETVVKLGAASDPYIRQMAQEIEAVSRRILSHLTGYGEKPTARLPENTILVLKSLSPGEILGYRHRRAVGFLVSEAGTNSHMAVIARSLMIPIAQIDGVWTAVPKNCRLIVDGTTGIAVVNPTDEDWSDYQRKRKRQGPAIVSRIKKLAQIPPRTADGTAINIAANLEFAGPVDEVLSAQRIPVGLYRTEFLYMERERFPDEEDQYQYYSRIAEKFADAYVVLRTFDLGSDKVKGNGLMPQEDNPALGWRGIRPMLELPDIFRTQVRAMLRASAVGKVRILLPMISDLSELKKARRLISQVMFELRRENVTFDEDVKIGIMVEVPSAALMADFLVKDVDFVSIGTNDLTQYTMSADRNNIRVAGLYNSLHPSVLSLIANTVAACKKHRTEVFICGEVAGDPLALPLFIGMGVANLSMNPTKIFDSCRLVKKIDSQLVKHLVGPVLASNSVASVMRKLQNYRNALEKK